MRITVCQIDSIVGDIPCNGEKIRQCIADHSESDIILFPECALCGYIALDYLLYKRLHVETLRNEVEKIRECLSEHQIAIVGSVSKNAYAMRSNSAFVLSRHTTYAQYDKQAFPDYDVFFEKRYFHHSDVPPLTPPFPQIYDFSTPTATIRCGLFVCYDLWETDDKKLTSLIAHHFRKHNKRTVDLIFWVSASPYTRRKHERRIEMARKAVKQFHAPLILSNAVGANDEIVFDGSSFAMDKEGRLIHALAHAHEDCATFELVEKKLRHLPSTEKKEAILPRAEPYTPPCGKYVSISFQKSREIVSILERGLKDFLRKTAFSNTVHMGLSGGIDSALTLTLAVRALGARNVSSLLLPSRYTSPSSMEDASAIATTLRVATTTISIEEMLAASIMTFEKTLPDATSTAVLENVQARIRGMLLMAYSNTFSSLLLTTGNKSEIAVGYCTLYGDMCGALNLIGDLYKTEVYDVSRSINDMEKKEIIPERIMKKAPSAELRPFQKDSDKLPEYPILDEIIRSYVEKRCTPQELAKNSDFPLPLLLDVWKMMTQSEHKRSQAAPIIKISDVAFGRGRMAPIAAHIDPLT